MKAQFGDGGAFTWYVSNEVAGWVSAVALRWGVHPTIASLGNVVLAAAGSGAIIATSSGAHPWWAAGWVAFICWPAAYIMDCVDGQVARVSGLKSEYGARVDVLADYVAHLIVVSALVTVVVTSRALPPSVVALVSGLWLFGTLAAVLRGGDAAEGHSLVRSNALSFVLRSVVDNGLITFVLGAWVLASPATVIAPVLFFTFLNATYLLATLGREAQQSMRSRTLRP